MKQLRNIIFDLGNVLVSLDMQRCAQAFARLGVKSADDSGTWTAALTLAKQAEVGQIGQAQFCQGLRSAYRLDASDDDIVSAWNAMLVEIADNRKQKLLDLRSRYRVFLLSNTNDMHWLYCARQLFPMAGKCVDDYFDRIFLSYEMHLAKPSPEIFVQAMSQAGIRADETLFIDDREDNCATARKLGLRTYQNLHINDWTHEDHLFE